jgi:nascent polypeptide-associated complex subunit alpha
LNLTIFCADDPNKKLNRGEKKCRKSLIKLGMKQLQGINRVTLKKRDGLIFVISEPEVLKSTTNEQSYAVFGELKLEDPNSKIAQDQASRFREKEASKHTAPVANEGAHKDHKEEDKKEDDGQPLNEEGLTANHIDMVM